MTRTDSQLKLRLPSPLKRWLENEAVAQRRSLNGQAVFYLERMRTILEREKPAEA